MKRETACISAHIALAKELECDDSEAAFEKVVKKVAGKKREKAKT